jgi:hypothetical protein
MKYYTIDQILALPRCSEYPPERVIELAAGRKRITARGVSRLPIPVDDRLWLLIQLADNVTRRLFACDCAERALLRERDAGREPDPRSWRAIEISRAYARGEATLEELAAAQAAAWAVARDAEWAAAWDVAQDAARDAAWAAAWAVAQDVAPAIAWAAALDAARDVAWAADREWQLAHLVEMM